MVRARRSTIRGRAGRPADRPPRGPPSPRRARGRTPAAPSAARRRPCCLPSGRAQQEARASDVAAAVIPHPVWCREVADDAAFDASLPGCPRLDVAEPGGEHRGRLHRSEVGDCFSASVEARAVQTSEFVLADGAYGPHKQRVQLVATNEDCVGAAGDVYLSPDEVDRLCEMLQRGKLDLEPVDARCPAWCRSASGNAPPGGLTRASTARPKPRASARRACGAADRAGVRSCRGGPSP